MVRITKSKQLVVVTIEASQPVQPSSTYLYKKPAIFCNSTFQFFVIPIFGHPINNMKQINMFLEQVVQNATTRSRAL